MTEKIATAGYPYPVDERIDDLRARIVEIRDAFIWAPGRVLVDDPARVGTDDDANVITEAILQRIGETKRELLIELAYFILLDRGIEEVRQLTARGVTVRILTNSAATNDVVAAHAGYANTREDLLNAGAELYELRPDSNIKQELVGRRANRAQPCTPRPWCSIASRRSSAASTSTRARDSSTPRSAS